MAARNAVLDAAEKLLGSGETADFSMRSLAVEAGVGFATPFNHFGSKNAIMQGLSARLIERMADRFTEAGPAGDAIDGVLRMGRIGVGLLLERPQIYKAVVGSLSLPSPTPSAVRAHSRRLWTLALGDFGGLASETAALAQAVLAEQLAFSFRGCISFWIAGDLGNDDLAGAFAAGAGTILLGFAAPARRSDLLAQIEQHHSAVPRT